MNEHSPRPGPEAVCDVCECTPGYLTTECPGFVLSAYQKCRVGRGRLDYQQGDWVEQIKVPRFAGTIEEVTAFLEAEVEDGYAPLGDTWPCV